jgi:hypothetical protein
MGLERERRPAALAGVRTFGLTGLLGALAGLLGEHFATPALMIAGFVLVAVMIIAANFRQPEPNDPGTTSVIALLVCYCLGAMVWLGYGRLAVMAAVGSTMLLYFKSELRGVASRLTSQDWRSVLQFSVLSLIVLPILPNRGFGPYDAINPHQVWMMVVLISGVSLAGYAALRFVGARYGAPLLGLLGGLVSSTATTMVFSRHARENPAMASTATLVILLANLIMVLRMLAIAWALSPQVVPAGAGQPAGGAHRHRGDRPRLAPAGQPGRAAGAPDPQPHRTARGPRLRPALRGGAAVRRLAVGHRRARRAVSAGLRLGPHRRGRDRPVHPAPLQPGQARGPAHRRLHPAGDAGQPGLQDLPRLPARRRRARAAGDRGMFAVGAGLAGGIVWLLNTSL